jgi:hypothetical protein
MGRNATQIIFLLSLMLGSFLCASSTYEKLKSKYSNLSPELAISLVQSGSEWSEGNQALALLINLERNVLHEIDQKVHL